MKVIPITFSAASGNAGYEPAPVPLILLQGGAAPKGRLARLAHNQEVGGSNPSPATNLISGDGMSAGRDARGDLAGCPRSQLAAAHDGAQLPSRTAMARLFFRLRKVVGAPALARVTNWPLSLTRSGVSLHIVYRLASSLIPARSFFVWIVSIFTVGQYRNRRAHRLGRWLSVSPQFGRYA